MWIFRLNEDEGAILDGEGHYSTDIKCTWLIQPSVSNNKSIHLRLEEFATECGWDHVYIYDGNSISDPLIAVYR